MNASIAAPIAALLVDGRKDYGRQAMLPHNVRFVLLGTSLLYFGWFGFNAGSALAANGAAVLAFANTMLAPMAALGVRMTLDAVRTGRATAVGAATAVIIGLVVVTPAAGFVSPLSALAMGALGAVPSYFAIVWRGPDAARRFARRAGGARRRWRHRRAAHRRRRQRSGAGRMACSTVIPRSSDSRPWACWRRSPTAARRPSCC